jgi:hypothetical protein
MQHAYRLVAKAMVDEAMTDAASTPVHIAEGQARAIQPRIEDVAQTVRDRLQGVPAEEAPAIVAAVIREEVARTRPRPTQVVDVAPSMPGAPVPVERDPDDVVDEPTPAPTLAAVTPPIETAELAWLVETLDRLAKMDADNVVARVPENQGWQLMNLEKARDFVVDLADAWYSRD